jgi:toxin YoeB
MISFSTYAIEHLQYWIEQDKKLALKILRLIAETQRDPFGGKGKPVPLKGDFKGYWSKRIDNEHRLVYTYSNGNLFIHSCRFHYTP